jgi:hypothetical protein
MDVFDRMGELWAWRRRVWVGSAPAMGRVMPAIGAVLMTVALGLAAGRWWAQRPLVKVQGTITENVSEFAPQGGVVLLPRVRFRNERGDLMTVVTRESKSWEAFGLGFDVGQVVPVVYPNGQPAHAMIAIWWRWYAWAVWVGTLGVLVFDIGWVARKTRPSGSA